MRARALSAPDGEEKSGGCPESGKGAPGIGDGPERGSEFQLTKKGNAPVVLFAYIKIAKPRRKYRDKAERNGRLEALL